MAEKSVIIAGFFNDLTGANAKLFESIADKDEKNKYVYIKLTNDPIELEDSSILLYKNFDEKIAKFAGEKFDAESINLFVSKNSRPDIFEFNEQNSEQVFGSGIHQHLIILSSIADSNYPEILKMVSYIFKERAANVKGSLRGYVIKLAKDFDQYNSFRFFCKEFLRLEKYHDGYLFTQKSGKLLINLLQLYGTIVQYKEIEIYAIYILTYIY